MISIVTGYGLDGHGSIPGRDKRFFSSLQSPDVLYCLLMIFSGGKADGAWS
jgi:hypothetical protein